MSLLKASRAGAVVTLALIVAGLVGAAPPPLQDGGNQNPKVVPPNSRPYGHSYAEWGERWWQWALSFPLDANPVGDETGELCDLGQSGPVWFLAGTFGGSTERTCTIPAGKALFFPIANVIGVFEPEPGEEPPTEEELRELLDFLFGLGFELECTVDGVGIPNLEDYRAQTGLFSVTVVEDGPLFPPGTYDIAIADGFWLMLSPLKPGDHTIHFRGRLEFLDLEVEVTYTLTVQAGP